MFKKILFISMVLLVAVALVVGYNKQKKMDTSNWETYRNEEMGFSLKYPDDIFDIKNKFSNEVSFLRNNHKCLDSDSLDEAMVCSAKNVINIEKTDMSLADFENNLKKHKEFYRSKKLKLRDDLTVEYFSVYSFRINLSYIFISSEKSNFIIQSSRNLDKINFNMASTFQFLE